MLAQNCLRPPNGECPLLVNGRDRMNDCRAAQSRRSTLRKCVTRIRVVTRHRRSRMQRIFTSICKT